MENNELKNDTIYLFEFALQVLNDNKLLEVKNKDNWVIGRDIDEHLKKLKND